jgi:hypothetical protein
MERLAEPLHLNLISIPFALFGSFRQKVFFDLVVRQQHAFALLRAADIAKDLGIPRICALEFGVAEGAGLLNMVQIGKRVTKETGVEIDFYGFDTGQGLPPPRDYRDHPEYYGTGDYAMVDKDVLLGKLPENAHVIFGDVADTVSKFVEDVQVPIAYMSIDVDYYWSTVDCLKVLQGDPQKYLPYVILYLDDIGLYINSEFGGELLAVHEFNQTHPIRRISRYNFIERTRLFRRPIWLGKMFIAHMFDHPVRQPGGAKDFMAPADVSNPYM